MPPKRRHKSHRRETSISGLASAVWEFACLDILGQLFPTRVVKAPMAIPLTSQEHLVHSRSSVFSEWVNF